MPTPFYIVQSFDKREGCPFFHEATFNDTDARSLAKDLHGGQYDRHEVERIWRFSPDTQRMEDVSFEVLSICASINDETSWPSRSVWAAMDALGIEHQMPFDEFSHREAARYAAADERRAA